MSDLEKWMSVIEQGMTGDLVEQEEAVEESKDCDCQSHTCKICFPDKDEECTESVLGENEIFDAVYTLSEDWDDDYLRDDPLDDPDAWNTFDEPGEDEEVVYDDDWSSMRGGEDGLGPDGHGYDRNTLDLEPFGEDADCDGDNTDGEESPLSCSPLEEDPEMDFDAESEDEEDMYADDPEGMVDLDMDDDLPDPEMDAAVADVDVEPTGPARDAGEDLSSMINDIIVMQDLGMSMSNKNYDETDLMSMDPRRLKAIHRSVLGEETMVEDKADKDYDGDGEIESGEEEYKGSRDKAIKKSMNESADPDVLRYLKALK